MERKHGRKIIENTEMCMMREIYSKLLTLLQITTLEILWKRQICVIVASRGPWP